MGFQMSVPPFSVEAVLASLSSLEPVAVEMPSLEGVVSPAALWGDVVGHVDWSCWVDRSRRGAGLSVRVESPSGQMWVLGRYGRWVPAVD